MRCDKISQIGCKDWNGNSTNYVCEEIMRVLHKFESILFHSCITVKALIYRTRTK